MHVKTFIPAIVMATTALTGSTAFAEAVKTVDFIGMQAPKSLQELTTAYTKAKAKVTFSNGKSRIVDLQYNALFGNRELVGSNRFPAGQLYDYQGNPIKDPNGDPVIAETPDGNSLLLTPGGKAYLVTQWEYDWLLENGEEARKVKGWHSRMPMSMSLTRIVQNTETGRLNAVDQKNIDFSSVGGLWIPCAASQTPWNTHLGAEEDYDLFLREKVDQGVAALSNVYFKGEKRANPFQYGHQVEVIVNPDGSTKVIKHYAMGRASWEKARVLDDGRTAYMGDDGRHTGLFMFVADRAGDLSEGTLYAAKWHQISAENGGKAKLSWIRLGHGNNGEIEQMMRQESFTSTESSIWDFSDTPAPGFKTIRAGLKKGEEHVRLKPGKEKAAAFLDSRRYAAYKGATVEFNKMEGVAYNARDGKVYIAMSYMKKGMMEEKDAPVDDIRLPKLSAGATYELNLESDVKDSDGNPIPSDLVATSMEAIPALVGRDLIEMDALGNTADPERVANPDNLFFSPKMRTLFIGEDSGMHANNFVWAYNVETKKLSRIFSSPMGAENTGLQVIDNLGGHAYIMSNYQHAGERIDIKDSELKKSVKQAINRQKAIVGYISGLPGM